MEREEGAGPDVDGDMIPEDPLAPATADASSRSPATPDPAEPTSATPDPSWRSAVQPAEAARAADSPAEPELLADGRLRELDPAAIVVETIGSWIGTAILAVPTVIGALLVWLLAPWPTVSKLALSALGLVLILGMVLLAVRWPTLEHRWTRWRMDRVALEIRRGVWWRRVISVPISRVQHTDVKQGPIQRRFGLATLVVHTAGTENASVELSGLRRETALALRDVLLASQAEDEA